MKTLFGISGASLLVFSIASWTAIAAAPAKPDSLLVYVGTYTDTGAKSKGIYLYRLNLTSGAMTPEGLVAETTSPSFLALHPNRHFLYAVNEVANFAGKRSGAVTAFSIEPKTGKLTRLNDQPSGGDGPCHLDLDSKGRFVFAANYGGGSIAAFPVEKDGRLGAASTFIQHQGSSVNRQRQKEPHAHFITAAPGDRFVLACDLGLDKVLVYQLDPAKGTLTPNDPPAGSVKPGAGPRHLAFHPSGKYVYVINEIDSTLTAFSFDAGRGSLQELHTVSTLTEPVKGNSTAEIQVHPSGKFVYGSNRGHNSIVVFGTDSNTGKVTYIEHASTRGKTPRGFGIDPTGAFLLAANQDSDTISVFRIDAKTGKLNAVGEPVQAPTPVCVTFLQPE